MTQSLGAFQLFLAEHDGDVGVQLEDRCGNFGGDGTEERAMQDVLLQLTVGDQNDLLCLHDRDHPHRDCLSRHLIFVFEETGVCADGGLVQIDHVRALDEYAGGLVEADVTVNADAEQLQVDAAQALDACIILGTLCIHILGTAVGDEGVFGTDVDVVEEVGLHEVTVALRIVFGQSRVLIKVDGGYLGEIEITLVVPIGELTVDTEGRGAGCQTDNALRLHDDLCGDNVCRLAAELFLGGNGDEFHGVFFLSLYL